MIDVGNLPSTSVAETYREQKPDFAILLNLAGDGDEAAFTVLIDVYEPGLRRTARRIVGHLIQTEVDTEDLIQSVHWILWIGLRDGKLDVGSRERLLAVARAILRRRVARVWKMLERRRRLDSKLNERIRSRSDLADLEEPARRLAAEDQFEHLCKMMTDTERRLIELRILGYSTAEAAREMGREPEILRVTLARLRKKLKASGVFADSTTRRGRRSSREA